MTTKNRKTKRLPPSRLRYEAANPTVSVRISRELHKELENLKEMGSLSMADIFKAGLDRLKPDTEASYETGLKAGYELAEEEFRVMAPCGACGEAHLPVTSKAMKAAVAERLTGWSAKSCS